MEGAKRALEVALEKGGWPAWLLAAVGAVIGAAQANPLSVSIQGGWAYVEPAVIGAAIGGVAGLLLARLFSGTE